MVRNFIAIENTKFIYRTNFSGDPERDTFGSDARKANLIIPDINQARELIDEGFNVKMTKPKEGEEDGFVPVYYVSIILNYKSDWPPHIYLVCGDSDPVPLNEETVGQLDSIYVLNINAVLNPYLNQKTGRRSLYVRTMYVEQDIEDDPYASRYRRTGE